MDDGHDVLEQKTNKRRECVSLSHFFRLLLYTSQRKDPIGHILLVTEKYLYG